MASELIPFNFQLNGRWVTKIDGCMLPDSFFQTLENFRYNDTGIESVKGMTAVSADFGAYKIENGFHFKKSLPYDEDHIFVQVTAADGTSAIYKSDNSTAIPVTDTYTLFKTLTDADGSALTTTTTRTAYFSETPDQSMIICDGYHNYVWSGDEYRASQVVFFDTDGSFSNDVTDILANNLDDATNVVTPVVSETTATLDTDVKLMLHFDDNYTDDNFTGRTADIKTLTPWVWNNGDVYRDTWAIGASDWIDDDSVGYSTIFNGFLQLETKAGSGNPEVGDIARVYRDIGTDAIPSSYTVDLIVRWPTDYIGGTLAGGTYFYFTIDNGTFMLDVAIAADGLFVHDGSAYNEIGNYTFAGETYYEYKFVVDGGAQTVDIYKDGVILAAGNNVDCSKASAANGRVYIAQKGDDFVSVAYVHAFSIGSADTTITYDTGKIGTKAIQVGSYSGTTYYLENYVRGGFTTPDHADFDFSGGTWTMDMWVKFDVIPTSARTPIFTQATSATDYMALYLDGNTYLKFYVLASDSATVTLSYNSTFSTNTWYHIEVSENGNNYYLFVNGALCSTTATANRLANYTGKVYVGSLDNILIPKTYAPNIHFAGNIDELRVSNGVCRHTSNFSPSLVAYATATNSGYNLYVGSTRPLTKVNWYVKTANTTTATLTGYYWDGTNWATVGTITRTKTSGATNSGKVWSESETWSFADSTSSHKPRIINDNMAYYYYFVLDTLSTATELYQCTVYPPVQSLVDIWDGEYRKCLSFIRNVSSAYTDFSLNVYDTDYYNGIPDTYADISSLASTSYLYAGFEERMTAIKVFMALQYTNSNQAVISVDYWNGSDWASVGSVIDGTATAVISLNKTGTISWCSNNITDEYQTSISDNATKWYYYRIHFSAALDASVYIDSIMGVSAQKTIPPYRYPVLWQNRLWLLSDQSNEGNKALGSSSGTVCVFNGQDSGSLEFGGSKEINCGASIFTRYGSNLYDNLVVCKSNETYLVNGTAFDGDNPYTVMQVSSGRGCIAPLTMCQCDIGYEVSEGVAHHALMWLSDSGVMMFDSNALISVSRDIDDRFSPNNTYSMLRTLSNKSAAFFDANRGEYHLLIPVGTSATYLNEEDVYDVVRKKWYQIKRGTKYLWCGFKVEDSYGNFYIFGGTGDGYIERLENGLTFDGVVITPKFRLSDTTFNQDWNTRKEVRSLRLIGKSKTTTNTTVAVSHYADGCDTATSGAVTAISNTKSGHRFYKWMRSISVRGVTHSFEFSISSSATDTSYGVFDPLFVTGMYKIIDEDKEDA